MKKFNQSIQITVEVDTIATNLLNTFAESFPHREMLTETIIAISLENNTIGMVYNNLMGFTNDIDFKTGQEVICSEEYYGYQQEATEDPNMPFVYKQKYLPIGKAIILDFNLTKASKVQLEYESLNSMGKVEKRKQWVDHKKLTVAEAIV